MHGLVSKKPKSLNKNCINYWSCVKENSKEHPEIEYIGKTTRKFNDRFAEHRDYLKYENSTQSAGEHFNSKGHSVTHLKGMVVEKSLTETLLFLMHEKKCIFKSSTPLIMAQIR